MELREFKALVAKSNHKKWLNSKEIQLQFPKVKLHFNLIGIVALYEFCANEIEFWRECGGHVPHAVHSTEQTFTELMGKLVKFVSNIASNERSEEYLEQHWIDLDRFFHQNSVIIPSKSIAAEYFLKNSKNEYPELYFEAALDFFTDKISNKLVHFYYYIGYLDAYLFAKKIKFSPKEFNEYDSIVNSKIEEINKNALDSVKAVNTLVEDTEAEIIDYKSDFTNWSEQSKSDFAEFLKASSEKITKLEDTYKAHLELQEPAQYWATKKLEYQNAAKKIRNWLVFLSIVTASVIFTILLTAPEYIFKLAEKNHTVMLVRWSALFVIFTVLVFVLIRLLIKMMLSYYHLARDAEERHVLTIYYLSLSKESGIDESQKNLIIQSLFARTDTGLLKEDSNPTLPNDLISKLFNSAK